VNAFKKILVATAAAPGALGAFTYNRIGANERRVRFIRKWHLRFKFYEPNSTN